MVYHKQLKGKIMFYHPKTLPGGAVLIAFARRIPNALEKALPVSSRAAQREVRWRRRRSHPPGMTLWRPTASRTQHKEFAAQQLGFKCRAGSHCQTTV